MGGAETMERSSRGGQFGLRIGGFLTRITDNSLIVDDSLVNDVRGQVTSVSGLVSRRLDLVVRTARFRGVRST